MPAWEDLKAKGNEAFRAGKFLEAIQAYSFAIVATATSPCSSVIQATLLSNRSAACLKIGSNQTARLDAEVALQYIPNDKKAQFRLASALFHLGSYRNALNIMRPMQSTNNEEIRTLLRHILVCEEENRTGVYDIAKIEAEERGNSRLLHANYCSSAIELRASEIGGLGGRGIFAKEDIAQGTLLVASKAIACGFEDELPSPEIGVVLNVMHNLGQAPSKVALANYLYMSLLNRCGRAILDLEGGVSRGLNIDLRRDDVYDETEEVPKLTLDCLEDLVRRNAFTVKKSVPGGWSYGTAIYHVPSFFNHSCMPNTIHYHIGDMIFIVSSTTILKGSEIFLAYYPFEGHSVQDRNQKLQDREGGFSCHCPLCRFETENASIVDPVVKLVKELRKNKLEAPNWIGSGKAVRELKDARRYLFKQFKVPVPDYDSDKIPIFDTKSPRKFSLAKALLWVLYALQFSLRQQRAYAESIPYIAEIHALIKDNFNFVCDEPLRSPDFAMTVWSHHNRRSSPKLATLWLEELKCICSLVGGSKFYEGKFHASVQDEIARNPCKEIADA